MKVFNLTDVSTPTLQRLGWVNMVLVAGPALIEPGGEVEVGDTPLIRRDIQCFTKQGALAVGSRPPAYLVAKSERLSKSRLLAMEADVQEKRKGKK